MRFKAAHMLKQYELLPEKLQEICEVFFSISKDNGVSAVVTRVSDPVKGESGVHQDHRAVDFRNYYFDGKVTRCLYSVELVEEILDLINNQYKRDDGYATIIHHSFNGGEYHFHIQIPRAWMTDEDRKRLGCT
jgi:hypothetical protein